MLEEYTRHQPLSYIHSHLHTRTNNNISGSVIGHFPIIQEALGSSPAPRKNLHFHHRVRLSTFPEVRNLVIQSSFLHQHPRPHLPICKIMLVGLSSSLWLQVSCCLPGLCLQHSISFYHTYPWLLQGFLSRARLRQSRFISSCHYQFTNSLTQAHSKNLEHGCWAYIPTLLLPVWPRISYFISTQGVK